VRGSGCGVGINLRINLRIISFTHNSPLH
jgi:hypothetical protein